jgi:hypothetical protein
MLPSMSEMAAISWSLYEGGPLIYPPFLSPIIADPSVLQPEESPDGRWHLFAHAVHGIYHYASDDGMAWDAPRFLFRHAMRPFIYHENGAYYLFYERFRKFHIYLSMLPLRWRSRIEARTSSDLETWSEPVTVLGPTLEWHGDRRLGDSVSNPCLVKSGGKYLLYYSSSLIRVEDCGFNEPKHIGRAAAGAILGPYVSSPAPMLSPSPEFPWCNLGCGSIKVMPCADGFAAFQNGIYVDGAAGRSGSAIYLLLSRDGITWVRAGARPVLAPSEGWMRSHIYACAPVLRPGGKEIYLYFNARDDWHWTKGKERIGLVVGRI